MVPLRVLLCALGALPGAPLPCALALASPVAMVLAGLGMEKLP